MEITKALCLSTVHITPETAKWLDGEPSTVWNAEPIVSPLPFTVWRSEFGWFIPVAVLDYADCDLTVPADLLACLAVASSRAQCEFLRLDGDGEPLEGLPEYEW